IPVVFFSGAAIVVLIKNQTVRILVAHAIADTVFRRTARANGAMLGDQLLVGGGQRIQPVLLANTLTLDALANDKSLRILLSQALIRTAVRTACLHDKQGN